MAGLVTRTQARRDASESGFKLDSDDLPGHVRAAEPVVPAPSLTSTTAGLVRAVAASRRPESSDSDSRMAAGDSDFVPADRLGPARARSTVHPQPKVSTSFGKGRKR